MVKQWVGVQRAVQGRFRLGSGSVTVGVAFVWGGIRVDLGGGFWHWLRACLGFDWKEGLAAHLAK